MQGTPTARFTGDSPPVRKPQAGDIVLFHVQVPTSTFPMEGGPPISKLRSYPAIVVAVDDERVELHVFESRSESPQVGTRTFADLEPEHAPLGWTWRPE